MYCCLFVICSGVRDFTMVISVNDNGVVENWMLGIARYSSSPVNQKLMAAWENGE